MHEKLQSMLKIYKEHIQSKQEVDVSMVIKIENYLTDLIPVIDQNSDFKDKKQRQEEREAVHFAVLNFFIQSNYKKLGNDCLKNDCLKDALIKYYENHFLLERLYEKIYASGEFADEQILIIIEGYLSSLGRHFRSFKNKVIQYQKACEKLPVRSRSFQMYKDMWNTDWYEKYENE